MGELPAERPELRTLALPRRGLDELLRGWTSDGQVFNALSAVSADGTEVDWSARDIELRAARVLLGKIESSLHELPSSPTTWLESLPITTTSGREISGRPVRPMNWATTARRYGWPPTAYLGHPRAIARDETTLQVLAWTAWKLDGIALDVSPLAKLLAARVAPQIAALVEVVDTALAGVDIIRPDRLDIRALAGSGRPWSTISTVADELLRAETDLEFLAFEIIEPIPELEWRLFHLSVFGEVLATLRSLGGRIRWVTPLGASVAPGPQFRVSFGPDIWDLWFEASAASRHYRVTSPYRAATSGLRSTQRAIGADIMLSLPGQRALMFECKWSADGTYVGRDGYHQASSYLVEARSGIAHDAWSYVIGPVEVVPHRSETTLAWPGGAAVVGTGSIQHVAGLVRAAVGM